MSFFKRPFLFLICSFFLLFSFYSQIKANESPTEILLFDNFTENNLNKWAIKSGQWFIENGILIGNHVGQFSEGAISAGSYSWNNYIIEFDINSYQGIDDSIYFRESQSDNAYIFNFRHGTGSYDTPEIKFFRQFNHIPIFINSRRDLTLNNNEWYHIKIIAYDDNIKLYVNNVKYFDFNDPGTTIKNGRITFTYWTGAFGLARVGIDNIKILSLNNPTPFLDLPWDYSEEGLSFNDAALAINSFFDHQYPLLSRGLDLAEPATASANIVNYLGETTTDPYSKHDGYDYGLLAKVHFDDLVLAAASGSATYINSCSSCGNMIVIDHGNGYQTRYMHLQNDGLITDIPNQPVLVAYHKQIGKVGFTGRVWPPGKDGAHIHFGIFQDKNDDSDFNDNEPDGAIDPFGWQSKNPDPWENYSFDYLGQKRTGNKSFYLWKNNLASMAAAITPNSSTNLNVGNYTLNVPQNATDQTIYIDAKSAPAVQTSNNLISVGSSLLVEVKDVLGNIIYNLPNPLSALTINLDFSHLDFSKIKAGTLSFYSSSDGINWNKENTSFVNPTLAQAQINHFSHFALLGEKRDIVAPITTPTLSGNKGQNNYFNSNVQLALNAEDNPEGSGIDYILYRINAEEIQVYKAPIAFTSEGHYKVEFYSADQDGNAEDSRSTEFDIDKTAPEISLIPNPSQIWPPNNKMVDVTIGGSATDTNLSNTTFKLIDEYGLIQPAISNFGQTIKLEAKRDGKDLDGRIYTILATSTDLAGNIAIASAQVIVPHDQSKN